MNVVKRKFLKLMLFDLIILASIVFENATFAVETIAPHSFVNGEQVSLTQVNGNLDRLYESANSWLPIFGQDEITRAHILVEGQPANANHLNVDFDQLLLSFNFLLSELQQSEILKLNPLFNGQSANASAINQNFDRLFSAANIIYATFLNTQFDALYQKVNSSLSVFGQGSITKSYSFEASQPIIADRINANFDQLFIAYNSLLSELQQNTIVKPYTFENGQNIEANQLNQNYQLLFGSADLIFTMMTDSRKIPDTGQTTCYDQVGNTISCPLPEQPLAQDGSYTTINQPDYNDNEDGTVTDNITGLVWQKPDNGYWTWHEANNYCTTNVPHLPGSGWRLPSVTELLSIVDFGRHTPASNPVFNSRSSNYWTSTTNAELGSRAWTIRFLDGVIGTWYKTDNQYVRCVRDEP